MEKMFTAKEVIGNGWEILKRSWIQLLIILAIVFGINVGFGIVQGILGVIPGIGMLLSAIVALISLVVSFILSVTVTKLYLNIVDNKSVEYSNIFKTDAKTVINYVLTSILYVLVILGGLILLIVPGFIFAYKYRFSFLLAIEHNIGPKEAFRISNEMTKDIKMDLFIMDILLFLVILAGFICLIIPGVLACFAVYMGGLYLYRKIYNLRIAETANTEAETVEA